MDDAQAGPHDWDPIKVRDFDGPVCRHCYQPKDAHPITGWVKARPIEGPIYGSLFDRERVRIISARRQRSKRSKASRKRNR